MSQLEKFRTVVVGDHELKIREFNGVRVIPMEAIDTLHKKKGATKKRLSENDRYFVENEDYYVFEGKKGYEALCSLNWDETSQLKYTPRFKKYYFTESGYLMIVKSFHDELAWSIQRQLVNSYFRTKEVVSSENPPSALQALQLVVDALKEQERIIAETKELAEQASAAIEEHKNDIEDLKDKFNVEPAAGSYQTDYIANALGIFSDSSGKPYGGLVKAIARECGLNTSDRVHEDEYTQVLYRVRNGVTVPVLFIKKAGAKIIASWWKKHKNSPEYYFEEFYCRNVDGHKVGELRKRGYCFGKYKKRPYYIQKAA